MTNLPSDEFINLINNGRLNLNETNLSEIQNTIFPLFNVIYSEHIDNRHVDVESIINNKEKKINYEYDIHNKYYSYAERLKSYKYWPKYHHVNAKKLTGAGFFYTGVGDYVKCICCDLVLHDFKLNDDPVSEHIKKSFMSDDICEYVKLFLDDGITYEEC